MFVCARLNEEAVVKISPRFGFLKYESADKDISPCVRVLGDNLIIS